MKLIDLKEAKAKRAGELTVKALINNLSKAVKNEEVKSVVYVALTKDDEVVVGNNDMVQTETIGLLECGKQLVIDDMYDY